MNTRCIVLCILLVLWAQIMKSLESAVIVDTTIDYCLDNTRCVRHSDSADPCQYHIDKNLGKSVLIWGQDRGYRVQNHPMHCTRTPSSNWTLLGHSNKLQEGPMDSLSVEGKTIYKITASKYSTEDLFTFGNTSVFENNKKSPSDWFSALKGHYLTLLRTQATALEKANTKVSEHVIQTVLKKIVIPLEHLEDMYDFLYVNHWLPGKGNLHVDEYHLLCYIVYVKCFRKYPNELQ
eukprot:56437_1